MRVTNKKLNRIRREKAFDELAVSIRIFFWHLNIDVNRKWSIIFNNIIFKDHFFRGLFSPIKVVKFELELIE